jgi:hypothetical protein
MKTYSKRSNARRAALAQLGADAIEGTHFRLIEAEPGQFAVEVIGQRSASAQPAGSTAEDEAFTPPAFLQREAAARATKAAREAERGSPAPTAAADGPSTPKPARTKPTRPRKAAKAKAAPAAPSEPRTPKQREGTKQALLIAMLRRPEGASVPEVVEATGWQGHTVRGAMFGALKKRLGLEVTSDKVEGRGRVYRVAG